MSWGRQLRVYSPGLVVIVLSVLVPFTGNSMGVLVARGVLIGISLLVSTREKMVIWRERRNGGKRER